MSREQQTDGSDDIAEDVLEAHLLAVCDGDTRGQTSAGLTAVVPYLSNRLLKRCHTVVWSRTLQQNNGRSKQRVLARLVASLTGGRLPTWEGAERPGQRMHTFLLDLSQKLRKAVKADRRAAQRAQSRAELSWDERSDRVMKLEEGIFHCTYGCTPAKLPIRITPPGQQPRMVEFETRDFAAEQLLLRAELASHRQGQALEAVQQLAEVDEAKRDLRECLAEQHRKEVEVAKRARQEERWRSTAVIQDLRSQAFLAEEAKRQAEREADQEQLRVKGELLRLGGQVARTQHEAGCAIGKLEDQLRKQQAENSQLKTEVDRVLAVHKSAVYEANVQEKQAAGRVLRLEGLLAKAQLEAGCLTCKLEAQVQKHQAVALAESNRAAQLADQLERQQSEAHVQVEELERECQRLRREMDEERRVSAAKETILSCHVARLHHEMGCEAKKLDKLQGDSARWQERAASLEAVSATHASEKRDAIKRVRDLQQEKEKVLETSQKRLKRKQSLEDEVIKLKDECDELQQLLEEERTWRSEELGALNKLEQMPTWRRERVSGRGGGLKLEHSHRLAILQQHANGTPSSAIGRNIVSIVKATAPWLQPVEPTVAEIRKIGFELTTVEEALSARRVASAFKVRLLGFDETQDRQEPSITSNVQIEATEGSELEDVVLKAAYLSTRGGESEAIVEEIEGKCFARLRDLLRKWKSHHQKMFPGVQFSGPDPDHCSLHRLAGGGALMSDTCNAARKAKRLLGDLIQRQGESYLRSQLGDAEWDALDDEQKQHRLRVHVLDCHQHMRNIFLKHMSRKQAEYVKNELAQDLQKFASWERMATDFDQLLRAVYKEFHHGGKYYKGKGVEFASWLLEHYPSICFILLERAEGGRQDLDFDAAVPIYFNRRYLVEYLHSLVFTSGHSNVLEDFLYTVLRSTQFIAMARANAIIDLRISRPLRWLAGKSAQLDNWSPYSMNAVLDSVHTIFQRAKDDGAILLDPHLEVFPAIADEQPLFRDFLEFTFEHDVCLSPDGKSRHLKFKLALEEALNPHDDSNKGTHAKTVEYLQVQCAAALEKMHDAKLALADKLSSTNGVNRVDQTTPAHADTVGCHATNDGMAESVFGAYKYERQRNPGISQRRASGLAQSRIMKSMWCGDSVQHRAARKTPCAEKTRGKRKHSSKSFGYFYTLPHTEQVALIDLGRALRQSERALDQKDQEELDAFRAARRRSNSELELESLIKQFALALSFFDRYKERGVANEAQLEKELHKIASNQERLDWLREQIEMRVVGLSWVEFKTRWSSSKEEDCGSIADLKGHLIDILVEEQERVIPLAAPAPIMQRKTFKQLGMVTAQAEALADQRLSLSPEQLREAAESERDRLERIGELDKVGDRQPALPPPLDSTLVGRKLEVRWRYWRPAEAGEKGTKKQVFIWVDGTVVEVSDGTIRKSRRSKDSLPSGALRIRWPADDAYNEQESYSWCILNPDDWNKDVPLGWRWDPSELRGCGLLTN